MGDDGRLVVAVAPLERVDEREPLLEAGERSRIVVDRLGQLASRRRDVVELGLEAREPLGQRLEPRVEAGEAAGLAESHARSTSRAPPLVAGERLGERRAAAGDRLAVLGGLEAGPDLLGLAGPQAGRRDLGRLVLGQLEPAGQLARIELQLGEERRGSSRQRSTASATAARSVVVSAEGVEQVALPALVEEPLLVVLAVDLDERRRRPRRAGRP